MKKKKLLIACLLLALLTVLLPASPVNKAADEGIIICNDMPPIDAI